MFSYAASSQHQLPSPQSLPSCHTRSATPPPPPTPFQPLPITLPCPNQQAHPAQLTLQPSCILPKTALIDPKTPYIATPHCQHQHQHLICIGNCIKTRGWGGGDIGTSPSPVRSFARSLARSAGGRRGDSWSSWEQRITGTGKRKGCAASCSGRMVRMGWDGMDGDGRWEIEDRKKERGTSRRCLFYWAWVVVLLAREMKGDAEDGVRGLGTRIYIHSFVR